MPNNRNQFGCPRLIYRIDSRPPEEIFEHGFRAWGTNTNFFRHILGYSLGGDLSESEGSAFISASDSPDSSLRFFGGMLNEPGDPLEYYLYEIRADNTVYSALRTASFYQQRINTGLVDFQDETDMETMIDAVDSIFGEFAYQREWFSVGPIPRERVRSAWRIDSVPIDPHHIRHQRSVYYTPRINEPEELNTHYVDGNTYANELPYTDGATLTTTSRVSVPSELVEADASGGVGSSLGFACSPSSSPRIQLDGSNSIDNKPIREMKCYFDKNKITKEFKKPKKSPFIFSAVLKFKLYLKGSKTNQEFVLSLKTDKSTNYAVLEETKNVSKTPDFIYDVYNCFSWNDHNTKLSYALSPVNIGLVDEYDVAYTVATVNDSSQKWKLDIVQNNHNNTLLRILSWNLWDFSLQRNTKTNKIYLRPIKEANGDYEELYVNIVEGKCDNCVLLPQENETKLVDIGLWWMWENINYSIIPETGRSQQGHVEKNKFFYDLNTYKILYINKQSKIFALKNNRQGYNWNWVAWLPSNLEKTSNKKFKWYFENDKFDQGSDVNYRNIRSFENNDWLWVTIYGSNWGSLFTTNLNQQIRSLALFRINPEADI